MGYAVLQFAHGFSLHGVLALTFSPFGVKVVRRPSCQLHVFLLHDLKAMEILDDHMVHLDYLLRQEVVGLIHQPVVTLVDANSIFRDATQNCINQIDAELCAHQLK